MTTGITYRRIWQVAFPIIIGQVAQNLMVVIDTAFLGRLGEVTLGAAAIGGIFFLTLVQLGAGFAVGTQIMIGRRNGERKYRNIGRIFDHAVYLMIALATIVFLLISFAAPVILKSILSSDAVLSESLQFLNIRRFGIFFGFLIFCFNSLYVGTTRTKVLSLSTFIMAMGNIILDYVLIFGHFGLPAMGIRGAALATNIAEVITLLFFLFWTLKSIGLRKYRIFRFWRPHSRMYKPLFRLAFPVMFQYFLSFGAWFVFFLIIEQIGETALAASNIARSFYMLLMIPVWGLSTAANTLVSNTIGAGKKEQVIPLIKKILLLGMTASLLATIPTIAIPGHIISFFTEDQELIQYTIPLFYVISMALMAFSFGIILFNGLSGTGKTMVALRIELLCIAIYLTVTFTLAVGFNASAYVVWFVEVIYFGMMGLLALLYLLKGSWHNFEL